MSDKIIDTRVRKTMSDFKAQFDGLTEEEKIAFLEELELLLAETRIQIQLERDDSEEGSSAEHKKRKLGTRVRKSLAEMNGMVIEDKEIFLSELELLVEGVRKEVQEKKGHN